jgi:hypothetical protein
VRGEVELGSGNRLGNGREDPGREATTGVGHGHEDPGPEDTTSLRHGRQDPNQEATTSLRHGREGPGREAVSGSAGAAGTVTAAYVFAPGNLRVE